ncbi:MAG: methionine--tRNA ligase [Minisyncoccota bacterium]
MRARYLTTTLPYVNANPHLGHALEFVQADFFARTLRAEGVEVFFNTGTDEHGAKVYAKAREAGREPREYADQYAARFRAFADTLGISYDAFTRTTGEAHKEAAREFWRRCEAVGDIYKTAYEVKYCIGCELEKTDSELVGGHCVLHPNLEIETRAEENYYFRLSRHADAILRLYESVPDFLVPEERKREMTALISRELKDFSISRLKLKMPWGIPVPGDDDHVMYVWFDALVNYISAIGWPGNEKTFKKWWPVTQFAGKDQVRQQALMWQAMLLSAGLPPSRQIFIHGFITSGGQKMSKSLGNVINPLELVERYGVEALRYVLLRHVSPFEDSDLTETVVHEHYTAHLTNGLGNLVARVMKLAEDHLPVPVALTDADEKIVPEFFEKIEAFRFNEAMDFVFAKVAAADAYMAEHVPYKRIKGDTAEQETACKDIEHLVRELARIAAHLAPAMPHTAVAIATAVRANKKPDNLFPRL